MPYDALEVNKTFFLLFSSLLLQLQSTQYNFGQRGIKKSLTIGSHPTTRPPPIPSPFRIPTGKLAQRAITGYPF